jgi:hypothetical protein
MSKEESMRQKSILNKKIFFIPENKQNLFFIFFNNLLQITHFKESKR